MTCENFICMYFCIQGKSKSVSFKGTKAGTNGTNPWKVNMCLALFEEIWLQNGKVIDFWKHASWFAQQVFNIRSKHQDVMFWIFTFSIFESSHLLVFECVITFSTALFWNSHKKKRALGTLLFIINHFSAFSQGMKEYRHFTHRNYYYSCRNKL